MNSFWSWRIISARAGDLAAGERQTGPLLLSKSGERLNRHEPAIAAVARNDANEQESIERFHVDSHG